MVVMTTVPLSPSFVVVVAVFLFFFSGHQSVSSAFVLQQHHQCYQHQEQSTTGLVVKTAARTRFFGLKQTTDRFLDTDDDDDFLRSVSQPLLWETVAKQEERPVLNLSARDASPEAAVSMSKDGNDTNNSVPSAADESEELSEWASGTIWEKTNQALGDLLDLTTCESYLSACPQLYRLDSTSVVESATLLTQEYGLTEAVLSIEPRLLAFPADDIAYGVRFLSTMMMMPPDLALGACRASPELLLTGIEQGIQERAVQKALSDASTATSDASKKIAGDLAATYNQIRNKNPKL